MAHKLMSSIFNEVLYFYWLGVQGQLADLVLRDYGIISLQHENRSCNVCFFVLSHAFHF